MLSKREIIKKGNPIIKTGLIKHLVKGMTIEQPLKQRDHLYGSDVAYCPRRAVVMTHLPDGIQGETNAASTAYMAIGTAIHNQIAKAFEKSNILLYEEYRVPDMGIGLGGYVDDIINLNNEVRIVEVKTCGAMPSRIKKEHFEQAVVYSIATGIRDPILLYFSRNVAGWDGILKTISFTVDTDNRVLFEIAKRVTTSYIYSQKGILPMIPAHIKSKKECGFCSFKKYCWESGYSFPLQMPKADELEELTKEVDSLARHILTEMPQRKKVVMEALKETNPDRMPTC